jgi:hypothetical protein
VLRLRLETQPSLTIEAADEAALDRLCDWLQSPSVRRELRTIRGHLTLLAADSDRPAR